jgi:hypothetical protein
MRDRRQEFSALPDGHGLHRIFEGRAAIAADFVGVTVNGEDAAQFPVVATESPL